MNRKRLELWQGRLRRNASAYSQEEARMDRREELYQGSDRISPLTDKARRKKTPHVRNLCAELIESQVDSNIPPAKGHPSAPGGRVAGQAH